MQEEEEHWISGEELYTEGSSDDDDAVVRRKRRTDGKARNHRRATPAKEARRSKSNTTPSFVRCSGEELGVIAPEVKLEPEDSHKSQSQEINMPATDSDKHIEISWRPKRGSIKLPSLSPEGGVEVLTGTDVVTD